MSGFFMSPCDPEFAIPPLVEFPGVAVILVDVLVGLGADPPGEGAADPPLLPSFK